MTAPAITSERVKELMDVATSGLDGIENLLKQARYDLDKKILEDGRDRWADFISILTDYEAVREENDGLAGNVATLEMAIEKAEVEVVSLKAENRELRMRADGEPADYAIALRQKKEGK